MFGIKHTVKSFSQSPIDLTLEQTIGNVFEDLSITKKGHIKRT